MLTTAAKRVVITGANGHVGYNLVKLLLQSGYNLRALVRSPSSPQVSHLKDLGIEMMKADVLDKDSLKAGFRDCDALFHLAAVYSLYSKDPENDIIKPACDGVINAFEAANAAGIKKIVMTSSIAAVGASTDPNIKLNESHFNDASTEPYFYAKTKSERLAWELASKFGIKLVTICPSGILGGGFFKHTPSTKLIDVIRYSKLPVAISGMQCFVDVKDVALAHKLALEKPEAEGRYIITSKSTNVLDLGQDIKKIRPKIIPPLINVPIWLAGILDRANEFFLGEDRIWGEESLKELAGKYQVYDISKVEKLGVSPRPFTDTIRETIEWIEQHPYHFA